MNIDENALCARSASRAVRQGFTHIMTDISMAFDVVFLMFTYLSSPLQRPETVASIVHITPLFSDVVRERNAP